MLNKKGFNLIELIVAMIIIGIIAAIALYNYSTMNEQGAASAAQNNLISIYGSEKAYYLNNGSYYTVATCPATTSDANLNSKLSLNITDSNFNYCCATDASGFKCYATNNSNGNFTMTLTNGSIYTEGSANCATSSTATCNPVCSSTGHTSYCP